MTLRTYDDGGGSGLWSVAAVWSADTKPIGADDVVCDATAVTNLTMDEASADLGSIDVQAGYSGKLDLGTDILTVSGNVTFAGIGEVDLGTGTHTFTDSVFTWSGQTTFDAATSTVVMGGTGSLVGHSSKDLRNLTIASGATITIDAATVSRIDIPRICNVIGDLVLAGNLGMTSICNLQVRSTGSITGASVIDLFANAGFGLTTFEAGGVVSAPIQITGNSNILAAGTYGGHVKVARLFASSAGVYAFASLELESAAAAASFDTATNGTTSVTVSGAFTVDLNSTGNITVDNTATAVAYVFQGDWTNEITGGGSFLWTRGTGSVTFNLSAVQAVDPMGAAWEAVTIDKTGANAITFGGAFDAVSLTVTDGTVDFSGNTVDVDAGLTVSAGAVISDPVGVVMTVGGNASFAGLPGARLSLVGSGAWNLHVTGTNVATFCTITNCDASGFTALDATDGSNVDGGGNTNVNFGTDPTPGNNLANTISGLSPVSYWMMQETSGTVAYDIESGDNDGRITNGATLGADGPAGDKAITFARASSQYIDMGDIADADTALAGDFSFGIWFKSVYSGSTQALISKRPQLSPQTGFHILLQTDGTVRGVLDIGASGITVDQVSAAVNDGQWHFAALTRIGATVSLYVDGSFEVSDSLAGDAGNTGAFNIGRRGDLWGANFDYMEGGLAHGFMYDKGLTPTEVLSIWNAKTSFIPRGANAGMSVMTGGMQV